MASNACVETCRAWGIPLALLPGDDKPDPELSAAFDLAVEKPSHRLWRYPAEGGPANAENFLRYAGSLIGYQTRLWAEPVPLLRAGFIGRARVPSLDEIAGEWRGAGGSSPILFYRALVQSGNTAPHRCIDRALRLAPSAFADFRAVPQGWRSGEPAERDSSRSLRPDVVLNATGFSVRAGAGDDPLAAADCPVFQVVFAGSDEEAGGRDLGAFRPRPRHERGASRS